MSCKLFVEACEEDEAPMPSELIVKEPRIEVFGAVPAGCKGEKIAFGDDFLLKCRPEKDKPEILAPGKYEGGFKLWECALDLVQYLHEQRDELSWPKGTVMELGCGHALPGIFASQNANCSALVVQDYNKDVLFSTTAKNVALNGVAVPVTYLSGPWLGMEKLIEAHSVQLILSAETLYSTAYYDSFLDLLEHCLAREGVAALATKRFYFGVGGSVAAFLDKVSKRNAFSVTRAKTIDDGASNIREILLLRRR